MIVAVSGALLAGVVATAVAGAASTKQFMRSGNARAGQCQSASAPQAGCPQQSGASGCQQSPGQGGCQPPKTGNGQPPMMGDGQGKGPGMMFQNTLSGLVSAGTLTADQALAVTKTMSEAARAAITTAQAGQGKFDPRQVMSDSLASLVSDGTLTADQAQAITAAMQAALKDLPVPPAGQCPPGAPCAPSAGGV